MVLASTPAFADTLTVNLTTDAPDDAPGDGDCDINEGTPTTEECTLRAAIMEANANSEPDLITVGVSHVTLTIPDFVSNDFAGDLDLMTDTATTVIDGNGVVVTQTEEDRVFEVHEEATAVIQELTMQGGLSP